MDNDNEQRQGSPLLSVAQNIWKSQGLSRDLTQIFSIHPETAKGAKSNVKLRSRQDFLDHVALTYTDEESKVGRDASKKAREEDRIRRLTSLNTKRRIVFSHWPRPPAKAKKAADRDDEGEERRIITPEKSTIGRMAGNGLDLWAATLFDFYIVQRIPGMEGLRTYSTGGKLSVFIRKYGSKGDLEAAKVQLQKADWEDEPRIVLPHDVKTSVRAFERMPMAQFMPIAGKGKRSENDRSVVFGEGVVPFSSLRPRAKLQHRLAVHRLPKKLVVHDPFGLTEARRSKLQKYLDVLKDGKGAFSWPLPSEDIPESMPTNVTPSRAQSPADSQTVSDSNASDTEPTASATPPPATPPPSALVDVTYVYDLHLSSQGKERLAKELAQLEETKRKVRDAVARLVKDPHTRNVPEVAEYECGFLKTPTEGARMPPERDEKTRPWVYALHRPPPWYEVGEEGSSGGVEDDEVETDGDGDVKMAGVEGEDKEVKAKVHTPEAHLYLSPRSYRGSGNHSIVYGAEWELPRGVLFDGSLKTGDEEDNEREGEVVMCRECVLEKANALIEAEDGPNEEKIDSKWVEKSGWYEITRKGRKGQSLSIIDDEGEYGEPGEEVEFLIHPGKDARTQWDYRGPLRVVQTDVPWQDVRYPICEHPEVLSKAKALRMDIRREERCVPTTATVCVTAKLSTGDEHLEREAANYQTFPDHFFEHWNGFNIIRPMLDPVPVGALVPQFYGYYTTRNGGEGRSAIMLLEDCGEQVGDVDEMSVDDRQECASLFYRMHCENWVHGSAYTRNVLVQEGPLNKFPLFRMLDQRQNPTAPPRKSFRLIDFGRSQSSSGQAEIYPESSKVSELFRVN
ncbi:hypothetical protein FA15DRAFT_620944 [Coprinopsis marcescibilis]|uniref:Protein kinase domain-containing protein n=1 Tax=Coprinopsis marcescibilis TaxID=230819 RepID=A0A5C3KT02_COPMA|nr:hypothetical protein FA15DRAFT_620944 [Coprinopsis marcescibilis]